MSTQYRFRQRARNYAPIAGAADAYVGPLDYRVGAVGVMGTRLFYTSYTGKALRVRNPDTNVESDIMFGADGKLKASEIASAKGGSSTLPVTKIYVQDASGNDYIQPIASLQPLLTQNGPDGEWCLEFDGSDDYAIASLASGAQPFARYLIFNPVGSNAAGSGWNRLSDGANPNTAAILGQWSGSNYPANLYAGALLGPVNFTQNTWAIISAVFNGASSSIRKDKTTATTGNAGSSASGNSISVAAAPNGNERAKVNIIGICQFNAADNIAAQDAVIDALASASGVVM